MKAGKEKWVGQKLHNFKNVLVVPIISTVLKICTKHVKKKKYVKKYVVKE